MTEWMAVISEAGFPIAVSMYLLYRIEIRLDSMIQSIDSLPDRMK
ncbi:MULTISPECIES: YvrJ family protein [Bacillaceae]|nr:MULTISPECIES: YvrJ family protein [Bacillaceae]MCE4047923.1 YvrJ family protein [Bacillus sp. Au-Bac7]MCM3032455.1 YvrJ family protein [Niallia sp. MER 6]MDL0436362.1 YvrJ family protein [Niallia sp. SS-2023]UPO89238.1 YvrJ family protein [Niallia sp. Man26]